MKRKSSLPQFAMPRRTLESCEFPFSVATPNFVNLNFERGFVICLWNYRWKASWNRFKLFRTFPCAMFSFLFAATFLRAAAVPSLVLRAAFQ